MKNVILSLILLSCTALFGQSYQLPCATEAWEESMAKDDSTYNCKRSLVET